MFYIEEEKFQVYDKIFLLKEKSIVLTWKNTHMKQIIQPWETKLSYTWSKIIGLTEQKWYAQ
jgi:hypothetical protein